MSHLGGDADFLSSFVFQLCHFETNLDLVILGKPRVVQWQRGSVFLLLSFRTSKLRKLYCPLSLLRSRDVGNSKIPCWFFRFCGVRSFKVVKWEHRGRFKWDGLRCVVLIWWKKKSSMADHLADHVPGWTTWSSPPLQSGQANRVGKAAVNRIM